MEYVKMMLSWIAVM